MEKYYLDAGTTYSKVICVTNTIPKWHDILMQSAKFYENKDSRFYYVLPSKDLKNITIDFEKACGHMGGSSKCENEIIALAKGAEKFVSKDTTVLDMGSRDAKWIRFKNKKFKDMDWNTSCASSTGATVEMLLKFYDIKLEDLAFTEEKFPVTCGIFGLEKIMDDISNGVEAKKSVSKFVHGIAYNAWSFAQKPDKIYLSGGFCENECFINSLKKYCEVEKLGRFVLCEGLINE